MSISAEAWSAISAFLSAIVAFLMLRIESRNFRNSSRPEIVISGWSRSPASETETITFSSIQNVGIGSALQIIGNAFSIADDDRPIAVMSTFNHAIIQPNSSIRADGEIKIWWKNVPGTPGNKSFPISINLLCWDTTGARYLTSYKMLVVELSNPIYLQDQVAPGILLSFRAVQVESVLKLKLVRSLSKLPLVGRFIKDKSVPA